MILESCLLVKLIRRILFSLLCFIGSAASQQSAIVIDCTHKKSVLFSYKSDAKRYPASLTKLMTIYILLSELKAGKIKLNTKFRVSKYATQQMPCKLYLKSGDTITVSDIIKALFVKSANDVAVVAAEGISGSVTEFVAKMNSVARKLKMFKTHFENPSGVPNSRQITTASDIAKLGIALFQDFPQYRKFFACKTFAYRGKTYNTHCKILRWYPGIDCAKTGYIAASGFHLFVTSQKHNRRLFVVVMGDNSSKQRDLHVAALLDKFFKKQVNKKHKRSGKFDALVKKFRNTQNQTRIKKPRKQINDPILNVTEEFHIPDAKTKQIIDELYITNDEVDDTEFKQVDEVHIKCNSK